MVVNRQGRHFLSILDLTQDEVLAVLKRAAELKARGYPAGEQPLKGKTLAMVFQKPSLRTRVSFETGMTRLGGHAIYLGPGDISIGKRETTEDIALVLSRYADVIMARVFGHDIVEELARHASMPVINGLSDYEHPCQILADFQTIIERRGTLQGVRACFIGDGNNVCHSFMLGAAQAGMHMTAITPARYEPNRQVVDMAITIGAGTGAKIDVTSDLSAIKGMEVLYTDVWASMGQEAEAEARKQVFTDYRIDARAMKLAAPDATILHCLPAHYGDEIDYETSRLPGSAIFDEAENRMHAQNALLLFLLGADGPARRTAGKPAKRASTTQVTKRPAPAAKAGSVRVGGAAPAGKPPTRTASRPSPKRKPVAVRGR